MKKNWIRLFAVLCAALILAGCSQSNSGEVSIGGASGGGTSESALTFATGNEQGTYYAFGNVIAAQVSDATDTAVTVTASQGSRENIQELQSNRAQFAFVQSDVMSYAYEGTNGFIAPVENFSAVCAMYMEQVQIVTLNPEIKSVSDLAGRRISVGDAASGVYFNAIDILDAYGIDISTGVKAVYESFSDSVESLLNGEIDAAFIVAGAPTNAVTQLANEKQVYLVSLDEAHINALTAKSRYYVRSVIPADAYSTPEDAVTVAVDAVVIARDDVSTEDVYNFVSSVYDHLDDVTAASDKGAELNLDFAASVTAVPYHQGAYNYFANQRRAVPLKEDSGH